MDVLLDVFDTYCFDKLYAKALPCNQLGISSNIQNVPYTWGPDAVLEQSGLENSCNVHESWWPRENVYRQSVSLFVVTLSVYLAHILIFPQSKIANRSAQDIRLLSLLYYRALFLVLLIR